MAKRKQRSSTPALPAPAAAEFSERPMDIIHDRLDQAHATLDLICTMTVNPEHAEELIEGLCFGTLHNALHGARRRIEEAMKAAERIP